MGYLTEVVIYNDALHAFREDPKKFGEAVLDAIDKANRTNRQMTSLFGGYANYICAEPSRHADHHALFLHSGNCLTVIGSHETDWENIVKANPKLANSMIEDAKIILKMAKESIKG